MSETARISLACLDLAGTTVADGATVETAFADAIPALGIVAGTAAYDRAVAGVRESRRRPKIDVFRRLFRGTRFAHRR